MPRSNRFDSGNKIDWRRVARVMLQKTSGLWLLVGCMIATAVVLAECTL